MWSAQPHLHSIRRATWQVVLPPLACSLRALEHNPSPRLTFPSVFPKPGARPWLFTAAYVQTSINFIGRSVGVGAPKPNLQACEKRMTHELVLERPLQLATLPTTTIEYAASDGKPIAETGFHVTLMVYLIAMLRAFFHHRADVYVGGNMFVYYEEGNTD